jgi:hypothetical protein
MPELTITSPYVHTKVDSNTFTMGLGNPMPDSTQPYAKVDLNPMPESTLSFSQGLYLASDFETSLPHPLTGGIGPRMREKEGTLRISQLYAGTRQERRILYPPNHRGGKN